MMGCTLLWECGDSKESHFPKTFVRSTRKHDFTEFVTGWGDWFGFLFAVSCFSAFFLFGA